MPAFAEPLEPPQPQYGWREVWAGADATRDVWLLYSGITIAPFSRDIYSDGWRFRMTGGYGRYGYDATRVQDPNCGTAPSDNCAWVSKRYNYEYSYSDVLVGYHLRLGELTAKAFAGATLSSHVSAHPDLYSKFNGTELGLTGALELWLNLGEDAWTSLDASLTSAHDASALRWRAGWRPVPTISIGPELRFDGNEAGSTGRAGAFARYEWFGGEVSAAGGIARSKFEGDTDADLSAYATLNVLFQY